MRGIQCIIKKELKRVFGDKKMIFSLFLLPAIIVIAIMNLSSSLAKGKQDEIDEHIPSVYMQNAPEDLEAFIKSVGVEIELHKVQSNDVETVKQQITDGDADILYVFDEGFREQINNYELGKIPNVSVFYNSSEDYSSSAQSKLAVVFSQYQQSLLAERFGGIENLTAFNLNEEDIVNNEKASNNFAAMMLPYLIPMLMFSGAMALGTDAIAGEKERGTLASMLLTPVKRSDLVLGKIISLSILASISAVIYGVSMIVSFKSMLGDMGADELTFNFSTIQIVELLVLMIGMVFLYVALIGTVSIFAKSQKEATSYVSPIYILVIVTGLVTMFAGSSAPETYKFMIPLYGNTLAMQGILKGTITGAQFGVSILGTILLGVVLVGAMTKAFNSEKVMFNA